MRRRSIHFDTQDHGQNPIPAASRIGPFIVTGGINGSDPHTGGLGESAVEQITNAFENLNSIMVAAGGSSHDIIRVKVHLANGALKQELNRTWVNRFPDPESRPTRKTAIAKLPSGMSIQLEAMAILTAEEISE